MSKKYQIEITETLQRIIEVKADSLDDAIIEIRRLYENEEIILNSSDYVDTDMREFNPEHSESNI
jgi:hypothetical protein